MCAMVTAPKSLFNRGRVLLHGLIYTDTGNVLPPLRWTRQAARFANDLLGQPLCSADELARRQADLLAADLAVQEERSSQGQGQASASRREAAPVVLYITDQDMRTRKKIEDILKGRE